MNDPQNRKPFSVADATIAAAGVTALAPLLFGLSKGTTNMSGLRGGIPFSFGQSWGQWSKTGGSGSGATGQSSYQKGNYYQNDPVSLGQNWSPPVKKFTQSQGLSQSVGQSVAQSGKTTGNQTGQTGDTNKTTTLTQGQMIGIGLGAVAVLLLLARK